jgi:hypothetical protein
MKSFLPTFYLVLCCLFVSPGYSQFAPMGPTVQIGPVTAFCADPLGNQVMNYAGSTGKIAMATVVNSGPAIVLDAHRLGEAPWAFAVFAYVHECAHHYLGDVINVSWVPNPQLELAADCFAAKATRDYGWLPQAQFDVAMSVLNNFVADAQHPPGPYRVQNAQACYSQP